MNEHIDLIRQRVEKLNNSIDSLTASREEVELDQREIIAAIAGPSPARFAYLARRLDGMHRALRVVDNHLSDRREALANLLAEHQAEITR
jgi:hypothetical protein